MVLKKKAAVILRYYTHVELPPWWHGGMPQVALCQWCVIYGLNRAGCFLAFGSSLVQLSLLSQVSQVSSRTRASEQ